MLSAAATEALAICVLSGMGLALAGWAVIVYRRFSYAPALALLLGWNYLMVRILWRARINGRVTLPPGQGAVIICNHRGPIDPAFIVPAVDRLVHWMVAKEYCVRPVLAWFFRTCEVIPTSRAGNDTAATKLAIRYARNGGLVGVFPEGRINTTDQVLLPGRPGAAMIALKARVPVVPCYLSRSPYDGTTFGCLLIPAKVRLQVGRPLDISQYYGRENDRQVLEELTRLFMVEIAKLAGQRDFQPRLAGRFYKPGSADD